MIFIFFARIMYIEIFLFIACKTLFYAENYFREIFLFRACDLLLVKSSHVICKSGRVINLDVLLEFIIKPKFNLQIPKSPPSNP